MKKILFATTALVATAGVAAAEVAIEGRAEIGIVGGDAYDDVMQFWTDVDIDFLMSGEADNGLTFGASLDIDETTGDMDATDDYGVTYFIAFGGARLDMGDVDGALDAAMTEVDVGSAIADDHTEHGGFNGNGGLDGNYDGQIATFSYAFQGFTGYLSTEIDDGGDYDPIWGIGVSYSAELAGLTIGVGIGYQEGDEDNSDDSIATVSAAVAALPAPAPGDSDEDVLRAIIGAVNASGPHEAYNAWGISLNTTFNNGLQAIVNYSERDFGDDTNFTGSGSVTENHWGLGFGYTMNALTVGLNYGEFDNLLGVDGLTQTGYGLAVNYDLGGGLEAQFGYGHSTTDIDITGFDASTDTDQYSLGLAMSF